MELKTQKPIIYEFSGKARHGKDTSAALVKKYYESKNKSVINLSFGSYIKEYAKVLSSWDGSEETKPRELLQILGTDVIRKKIDAKFFIKKLIDDIKVYSYFYDVITISDARFKFEINDVKNAFDKVYSIKVIRPNFDNGLTLKEQKHLSEIDLDDYDKHDYTLNNDGSIDDLEQKIINIINIIEGK